MVEPKNNKMNLQEKSKGIIEVLSKRMMHQYKSNDWPQKLADQVLPILKEIESTSDFRMKREMEHKYAGYISPSDLRNTLISENGLIEKRWANKLAEEKLTSKRQRISWGLIGFGIGLLMTWIIILF